jgi:hypothetical protein
MGNWMLLKQLRSLLLAKCLELDDEAKDGCNDMHVISTAVLRVSAHDADMRRHSMAWQLDDGAKRCLDCVMFRSKRWPKKAGRTCSC